MSALRLFLRPLSSHSVPSALRSLSSLSATVRRPSVPLAVSALSLHSSHGFPLPSGRHQALGFHSAPMASAAAAASASSSSSSSSSAVASKAHDGISFRSEEDYHRVAEESIHQLLDALEELGDSTDLDGFDLQYSNGVLNLKLGDLGTYVVNKQPPNKQIWLSSPVSGPKRFDFNPSGKQWIYRRTNETLERLLSTELSQLLKTDLQLKIDLE